MSDEMDILLDTAEDAVWEGIISCSECGETMEPDCEICPCCGKPNPLVEWGMI
jgi:RNA polymerase subunit RPABC4/transcription elongation factor Spt4